MSASPIFELWSNHNKFIRVRIGVECQAYDLFRNAGRNLMRLLLAREEDTATALLGAVHSILGEVATVPVSFDTKVPDRVRAIGGGVARVKAQWGSDCANAHQEFIDSALALCSERSALRDAVEQVLIDQLDSKLRFFCHRNCIDAFTSLGATPDQALTTTDSYRKADPFETLLKVGPVRSVGFGRMPEAILAAPRFVQFHQVTWACEHDEPAFGEARMEPLGFSIASHWESQSHIFKCGHPLCDSIQPRSTEDGDCFDEQIWTRISRIRGPTLRGTVLKLSGSRMLMQRPGSEIATYSPASGRVVLKEAEDVAEGDVILHHEHISLDLGPVATSDAPIVREWREALRVKYSHNTPLFLGELKRQGLRLVHLGSAVKAWMSNQRPQQEAHFEIVSRVIGWDAKQSRKVWRIFSEQHGAAVQHGLIGAALATEALVNALNGGASLEVLRDFAIGQHASPLRLPVEIAGSNFEVQAFTVEEVESSDSLIENYLGQIVKDREEFL